MNDRRRYQKSLQNIYKSKGCLFFIRRCLTTSAFTPRPTMFNGLCGDGGEVGNVLKQWRAYRVDVDAKNKSCLELMMTVLMEGAVHGTIRESSSSVHRSSAECTLYQLEELIINIFGIDWVKVIAKNENNLSHY